MPSAKHGALARWRTLEEAELTGERLRALFENENPLIRIGGFATGAECQMLATAIAHHEMKPYTSAKEYGGATYFAGYIGVAQMEYRLGPSDDKAGYFAAARWAKEELEDIFRESFDPLQRLLDLVAPCIDGRLTVAEEPGYGPYLPCAIRRASAGLHRHTDFAPLNSPGWEIAKIDAQLTANFYVQEAESGGDTTLFNHLWAPEVGDDERAEHLQKGLPTDLPKDVEEVVFRATAGDVVLFNPRNPHEVVGGQASEGHNRLSVGLFFGRMPDGTVIYWGS